MYVGTGDTFATVKDARWIASRIRSYVKMIEVNSLDHTEMQHYGVDESYLPEKEVPEPVVEQVEPQLDGVSGSQSDGSDNIKNDKRPVLTATPAKL